MPRPRLTRKTFHLARLIAWIVQLPLIAFSSVRESVPYLVFLSLAALIESAGTDYDQARVAERDEKAVTYPPARGPIDV